MSSNIQLVKICDFCGSSFIAQTTVTRYCQKICNNRHYKQLARNKKIEKSNVETKEKIESKPLIILGSDKLFFSIAECSQLLKISRTTLWRLIKDGRLKVTRLGSRVIISKEQIYELFKQ